MDFLEFTSESEVDFESGHLPTLDTQTRVIEKGTIEYMSFPSP